MTNREKHILARVLEIGNGLRYRGRDWLICMIDRDACIVGLLSPDDYASFENLDVARKTGMHVTWADLVGMSE